MESADRSSTSEPRLGRNGTAALVAAALLGSSLLVRSTSVVDPATAVGTLVVLSGLAIVIRWRGLTTSSDASEDDGPASVWNAIPSRQYEGRHVESGGIARSEQERALQDIKQQADELADEPPNQ